MTVPQNVRVLAITSEPPWPLNSGGHLRTYHLLHALSRLTDLRVVCPYQPDQVVHVDSLRQQGWHVVSVPVVRRSMFGELTRLCRAGIHREPYVMYRRHDWCEMHLVCQAMLRRFRPQVLYLDHLDSLIYQDHSTPTVIDMHNVYSLLTRRTALEQRHRVLRSFLKREAALLDRMERRAARTCMTLTTVSQIEAEHFREHGANSVHVIPNGVNCATYADLPVGRMNQPPVILFLGSMSWGPNESAAEFLIDAMPRIQSRIPNARLQIVGRDPSARLRARHGLPGVEVIGGVPDVKPYFASASLLAVPLDAGGGTRLKILEAFAAGLPVVSTAVGAEGIDAVPGEQLILAERHQFADRIVDVLQSPEQGVRIADAARQLAQNKYDWHQIGRRMADVVVQTARG